MGEKQSKMKDDPAWKLTQELGIGMMEARARIAAASVGQISDVVEVSEVAPLPAPEPSPSLVDSEPE